MNEAERRVLLDNRRKIKDNLNLRLDTGILDELAQGGTLTENQVDMIEAEKTNEDQIKLLLNILPTRGPHAFKKFMNAIRKNSSFLADILEEKLNKELRRNVETNQDNHSCEDVSMESDISTVPKYINENKNSIELKGTTNINTSKYLTHSTTGTIQQNLSNLCTKLKTYMISNSMMELSFHTPQPISFDMIDELLEDLFTTLDKCYKLLGGKDRSASLESLITDLKSTLKSKEQQRNKYADYIMKLENKLGDEQCQTERFKKELENLWKENNALQKHVQEADTKLREDEKEKLKVAMSNEVENEGLKDENKKLHEEIEEMKLQNIKLTSGKICPKCQSLHRQESNSNNTERAKITGKKAVRQIEKDMRKDSHGAEQQKFLRRIHQQDNARFQPNMCHSQTITDVKETGKLHQHNARCQPNIYHSQPKLDVKDTRRLHPNTKTGNREQVRRQQLNQSTKGLQQGPGVTLEPSLSRENNPYMNAYAQISDEPKRKFFGGLRHAKR